MHRITMSFVSLAGGLAAQSIVSPAHFATAPGNSNGYAGVGHYASISRHLQVHDDLAGTPRLIHRVALRRDTPVNDVPVPASTLVCDLRLSTAASSAAAPLASFDANHGTNAQTVASFQLYQLPASPPTAATMPFEYVLPFNQPWSFDGQGPLAWEIRVHSSNTSGGFLLDACANAGANPKPAAAAFGRGCRAFGANQPATLSGDAAPSWSSGGMTLSWLGGNLPANTLTWLALGTSSSAWGNLALPAEVPLTAQAASGACTIYTDWTAFLPVLTNASGTLSTNLGASIFRSQHGRSVFAQAIALDPNANSYGAITSNLVEHVIVAPFGDVPVGQVSLASSHGANGQASARRGAIVRFD